MSSRAMVLHDYAPESDGKIITHLEQIAQTLIEDNRRNKAVARRICYRYRSIG